MPRAAEGRTVGEVTPLLRLQIPYLPRTSSHRLLSIMSVKFMKAVKAFRYCSSTHLVLKLASSRINRRRRSRAGRAH